MRGSNLIYNAETARQELPLLDAYEKVHPPARRLLSEALGALGGSERVASLDGWIVEGRGRENLSAELQGIAPEEPTWRPHEEKVAVVTASGSVAWQRRTPRNDQSVRWRRFIYEPKAFGVVDFNAGYGRKRPREIPEAERQALERRIPHLLLLEAATRSRRLIALGPRTIDGVTYDTVEATLSEDTRLTLLLTRDPGTLARAEYAAYLPGLGDCLVAWEWTGWRKDPGLGLAPSGHRITVNGTVFQEVAYDRYAAGARDAAADPDGNPSGPRSAAGRPPAPDAPLLRALPRVESCPACTWRRSAVSCTTFIQFGIVVFDAPASAPGLEEVPAAGAADVERVTGDFLGAYRRRLSRQARALRRSQPPPRRPSRRHPHRRGVTILAAPGRCRPCGGRSPLRTVCPGSVEGRRPGGERRGGA